MILIKKILSAFLPCRQIILYSRLGIEELKLKLKNELEPKKYFALINTSLNDYEGELKDNSFEINRISFFRNVFQPVITGKFIEINEFSKVEIKIKTHLGVIVIISLWSSFCLLLFFGFLLSMNNQPFSIYIFTPLVMPLFPYLMNQIDFLYEYWRSKSELKSIFNAETMPPARVPGAI